MNVYLFQAEVVKSGWRYPISPQKKQAWHRNCYNSNAHHTLFIYWQDVLDYSEPHCITIYGKCHMVLLFDKMWHDMSETSITKVRRHFSPEQFQHSITCMNVLAYFPYVLDTLLIPFFFSRQQGDTLVMPNGIQMEPTRWSQLHFTTDDHATDHIPHLGIVVIELRYNQVYYDNNRLLKYASQWKSL